MTAKALILAAGAGTRMKSDKPKGCPRGTRQASASVRWVVDAAHDAGIEDVCHRARTYVRKGCSSC